MRFLTRVIILSFISIQLIYSQSDTLKKIRNDFENFKYSDVVSLSNQFLKHKNYLTHAELIKIYTLQGASYFSLSNNDSARIAFTSLLQIDSTFNPDSSQISPKIISFFNQTKRNFLITARMIKKPVKTKIDSVSLKKINSLELQNSNLRGAQLRSIFLPGWGQLYLGSTAKGILLMTAGLAALGSSIYFIIDTKNKENKYLSETDPGIINGKYNSYNSAYKIRNVMLISYVVIWLYTQIDLLLFSNNSSNLQSIPLTNKLNLDFNPSLNAFSLQLNF